MNLRLLYRLLLFFNLLKEIGHMPLGHMCIFVAVGGKVNENGINIFIILKR